MVALWLLEQAMKLFASGTFSQDPPSPATRSSTRFWKVSASDDDPSSELIINAFDYEPNINLSTIKNKN